MDYLPFGETRSGGWGTTHKFTGDERDSETGLDHTLFRQYSSSLGRWSSPDPLAGDISDPQSLNRYSYVGNNPLAYVDPLGANSISIVLPMDNGLFSGSSGDFVQLSAIHSETSSSLAPNPGFEIDTLAGNLIQKGPYSDDLFNTSLLSFYDTFGIFSSGAGPGFGQSGSGGGGNSANGQTCGSGFGLGVGFIGTANADAGLGFTGATATVSAGAGLFYDSKTGSSSGRFAAGAAVANFLGRVAAVPSQSVNGGKVQPVVGGAYAGIGGGIFLTNAHSVQELSGPFKTFTVNVGYGPYKFSASYASAGNIGIVTIMPPYAGAAVGVSVTRIVTTTATNKTGCH